MLWVLLRRELRDICADSKAAAALAFFCAVVLTSAAGIVSSQIERESLYQERYHSWRDEIRREAQEYGNYGLTFRFFRIYKPVPQLAVLAVGLDDYYDNVYMFNALHQLYSIRDRTVDYLESTMDAPRMDVTFIISCLLSLVAVTLGAQSVVGERIRGTLQLLLSYGVRRRTIMLAKCMCIGLVLSAFVLLALCGALTGLVLAQVIPFGLSYLGVFCCLFAGFTVFLFIHALVGVFVGFAIRSVNASYVWGVFAWFVISIVGPNVGYSVGLLLKEPMPRGEVLETMAEMEKRGASERAEKLAQLRVNRENTLEYQDKLSTFIRKQQVEFAKKERAYLEAVTNEEREQVETAGDIARLFPGGVLNSLAANATSTGWRGHVRFHDEVVNFAKRWEKCFAAPHPRINAFGRMEYEPVPIDQLPSFAARPAPLQAIAAGIIGDLAFLVSSAAVLFLCCARIVDRIDCAMGEL